MTTSNIGSSLEKNLQHTANALWQAAVHALRA